MKRISDRTRDILNRLDVAAAMRDVGVLGFVPDNERIALAGLHKARLKAGRIFTKAQRIESAEWLASRGFKVPGRKGYQPLQQIIDTFGRLD
jgi:hypothetical protein